VSIDWKARAQQESMRHSMDAMSDEEFLDRLDQFRYLPDLSPALQEIMRQTRRRLKHHMPVHADDQQ